MGLLILLLLPLSALGLTLGEAQVRSHLDQPLTVEIELTLAPHERIEELQLALATPDQFSTLGLPYPVALASLQISTQPLGEGRWLARLQSHQPINTPLLSLILRAEQARGELLKNYDLFIDPATTDTPNLAQAPPDIPAQTLSYGPIRPGESLSMIATRMRGERPLQLQPLIKQLFRDNPDAFIEHDINRLRSGCMLQLSGATLAALPLRPLHEQPIAAAPRPTAIPSTSGYGPVQAGDTLSVITQQLRPDPTIPLPVAMQAILQNNPDAFIQQDPSRLKQGVTLHYPPQDTQQLASQQPLASQLQQLREHMQQLRGELHNSIDMVQSLRQQNASLLQQTAAVQDWLSTQQQQLLVEQQLPDPQQLLAQAQRDNPFNRPAMLTALGGLLLLSMPLFGRRTQRQMLRLGRRPLAPALPAPRSIPLPRSSS